MSAARLPHLTIIILALLAVLPPAAGGARERTYFALQSGRAEVRLLPRRDSSGYELHYLLDKRLRASCGRDGDYVTLETPSSGEAHRAPISGVTVTPTGLQLTVKIDALGLLYREAIRPRFVDQHHFLESRITLSSTRSLEGLISRPFRLETRRRPFFLVPGYLYGTNNAERAGDVFPQLDYRGETGTPKSAVFFFRSDRSSHCAVEALFGKVLFAVATAEGCRGEGLSESFFYNGLGIDTSPSRGDRLSLTLGYRNFPARYNGNCSPRLAPRWESQPDTHYFQLEPGRPLTTRHIIYLAPAKDRFAFESAQRVFYWALHERPTPKATRLEAMHSIASALMEDSVVPECGLFRVTDRSEECDIGWTGGMMVAYPLLRYGMLAHHAQAQRIALGAIDSLCENGFSDEAGLFFDAFREGQWTTEGWWSRWSGGAHLTYTNGQAAYYILCSYSLLDEEEKLKKKLWLERVRRVLDSARREQWSSGEFPVAFAPEDGRGLERPGFAGCWFLPAMAEFYRLTGERAYLRAAQRAERFYFDWLSTYEVWGTPVDAENAVDQEGNMAFVLGCMRLYEATGDPRYREHALRGLHHDLSWKYAYPTHVANEPLRSLGWESTGGNGASCCNIHLHPMGTLLAEEHYALYRSARDYYLKERLRDTLVFSLGTFNRTEGEFGFGKKGWVTEQFFHTDAIQGEGPPDGGIWRRYLPWAAASVLAGLTADIPDDLFQ